MWHIYDDVRYTVEQEQNSSLAYTGPLYTVQTCLFFMTVTSRFYNYFGFPITVPI